MVTKDTKGSAKKEVAGSPAIYLKVGDKAPLFTLLNQEGKEIALEKILKKEKVLIYFYPKALTPGCTVQAKGIRDSLNSFKEAGVKVFGISGDQVSKLQKFTEKEELNFDLLSDLDFAVSKSYGVYGLKKFMGRSYMGIHRVSYLVGKGGKILAVMDKVKTATHHLDVLELFQNL